MRVLMATKHTTNLVFSHAGSKALGEGNVSLTVRPTTLVLTEQRGRPKRNHLD